MDKQSRLMLAVGSTVIAVFMGINFMTDTERSGNWLLFAIIFAGLAFMFWWWMGAEERRAKAEADRAAQERIRQAEDQLKRARDVVQPTLVADAHPSITPAEDLAQPEVETVEAVDSPVAKQPDAASAAVAAVKADESVAPPDLDEAPAVTAEVPAPDNGVNAENTVEIPEPHAVEVQAPAEDKQPIPSEEIPSTSSIPSTPVEPSTPPVLAMPKESAASGEGDDLTRIEGIGPYYRDILHAAGITTFAVLAKLSKEEIDGLISSANARRTNTSGSWSQQAALAADGKWDELTALQGTLSGGRRRS